MQFTKTKTFLMTFHEPYNSISDTQYTGPQDGYGYRAIPIMSNIQDVYRAVPILSPGSRLSQSMSQKTVQWRWNKRLKIASAALRECHIIRPKCTAITLLRVCFGYSRLGCHARSSYWTYGLLLCFIYVCMFICVILIYSVCICLLLIYHFWWIQISYKITYKPNSQFLD